ncbi:hypothetical protein As57867_003000, partial [Aphanomyces stellatus]
MVLQGARDGFDGAMQELKQVFQGPDSEEKSFVASPLFLQQCADALAEGHYANENILQLRGRVSSVKRDAGLPTLKQVVLHHAINANALAVVVSILQLGVDLSSLDESGSTPLGTAVTGGHSDIVAALLAHGADVNAVANKEYGMSALAIAARDGHDSIAHTLLRHGADVDTPDLRGRTALYHAIAQERLALALAFLNAGADPSKVGTTGKSPLWLAVASGEEGLARRLVCLASPALINAGDCIYLRTPLWMAARDGHVALVEMLLDAGANTNATAWDGQTVRDVARESVLHLLGGQPTATRVNNNQVVEEVSKARVKMVVQPGTALRRVFQARRDNVAKLESHEWIVHWTRRLLDFGDSDDFLATLGQQVQLDDEDRRHVPELVLRCAVLGGFGDVVQILVERGADVNFRPLKGHTPLMSASQKGWREVVQLLMWHGASVDAVNMEGETALWFASKHGHVGIVRDLLQEGAKVDVKSTRQVGASALWMAASCNHDDVVQALVGAGAAIDLPNAKLQSPLYAAAYHGHETTARLLLDYGADVNIGNADMDSLLLHAAATHGHDELVRLLIDHGARFQSKVLVAAAANGHASVVDQLLQLPDISAHIIDLALEVTPDDCVVVATLLVNCGTRLGTDWQAALWCVCAKGRPTLARLLLAQGANPNGVFHKKRPLWVAALEGHDMVVRVLLDYDADVNLANVVDFFERTPLWAAACKGHVALVTLFLACGAHVNPPSTSGNTPLWIAADKGHVDVIQTLVDAGADVTRLNQARGSTPYLASLNKQHYAAAAVLCEHVIPAPVRTQGVHVLRLVAPHLTPLSAVNLLLADLPFDVELADVTSGGDKPCGYLVQRPAHMHSWTLFQDGSFALPPHVRVTATRLFLTHARFACVPKLELHREFAALRDPHGRDVLSITDEPTRRFFHEQLFFCGRYELLSEHPIHKSATAVVVLAYDHGLYDQLFAENCHDHVIALEGFLAAMTVLEVRHRGPHARLKYRELFGLWDKQRSGGLGREAFFRCCSDQFGKYKVALKFMRHAREWERETQARHGLSPALVVQTLPGVAPSLVRANVGAWAVCDVVSLAAYPHLLVLPPADRSLEDIFTKERPDAHATRTLVAQVVAAVQHLHGAGLVHGDLKMLNVLRFKDSQLKLIDLDASAAIGEPLGAKVSSGVLPPEMFTSTTDGSVNIKTWHGDDAPTSYALVCATPAMDLWALGCLVFRMCSSDAQPLLPTNRDDNLAPMHWRAAMTWTDAALDDQITTRVHDTHAADLVRRLLRVAPDMRLPLDAVRRHPFFVSLHQDGAVLHRLASLEQSVLTRLDSLDTAVSTVDHSVHKAKETLLRATYDAADVDVPTSFVLLPIEFDQETQLTPTEREEIAVKIATFVLDMDASLASSSSVGDSFWPGWTDRGLFLYLVDERTRRVLVPPKHDLYPIHVSAWTTGGAATAAEAYVPLLQTGLGLLQRLNDSVDLFG